MSHEATHWLAKVEPADMSHGEFRVLFHLCDCHNASMGCFPAQAYLREHTGMSNGGLNKALRSLEDKGLIRREQTRDTRTNRQRPTRYMLGFEISKTQEPTPLSGDGKQPSRLHSGGDGAVSTESTSRLHSEHEPSPLSGVIYKDEPVKEPVKEPCALGAHTSDFDLEDLQERFVAVYPRAGDTAKLRKALAEALGTGVTPDDLIAAARAYAEEQRDNRPQYIAYPENWLAQRRWELHANTGRPADPNARLQATADLIAKAKPYLCTNIPAATVRELIHRGLVTEAQCREAGVQW